MRVNVQYQKQNVQRNINLDVLPFGTREQSPRRFTVIHIENGSLNGKITTVTLLRESSHLLRSIRCRRPC